MMRWRWLSGGRVGESVRSGRESIGEEEEEREEVEMGKRRTRY